MTSVDISEEQRNVAHGRAAALGLQVDFVRADVVDLSSLYDETYDIVYTGGHVILKPAGLLIVSEYHPFGRVWKDSPSRLEVGFNYFDRGSHRFKFASDVPYTEPVELEQFEFHWTMTDYISAILSSRCQLVHAEEFGDTSETWEGAPVAGVPATLLLVGRRNDLEAPRR